MTASDPIKQVWQDSVTHAELPDIRARFPDRGFDAASGHDESSVL